MSGFYLHATADEIARAVVIACRHTGDDPIRCVTERQHDLARLVAIDGLREALPDCNKSAMARGLGFGRQATAHTTYLNSRKAMLGARWPFAAVKEIVAAISAPAAEPVEEQGPLQPATVGMGPGYRIRQNADGERWVERHTQVYVPPPEKPKARLPDENLPPRVTIANIVKESVTSNLMGDPAPGRSAFDQRKGRA